MSPILLSLFLIAASALFIYAARVLLRIDPMKAFIARYKAGNISLFEQIFFLNISFYPKLFDKAVETIGDKIITRLLHAFAYFLILAALATISASVTTYIVLQTG